MKLIKIAVTLLCLSSAFAVEKPNIVIFLADDMGYGEIQHLNPKGKIKTPHLDNLAKSGMTFTDAHSGSAVCTPTRYGLMTGRYSWRTRMQSGVLTGGESLISAERMTLAKMLKAQGYHTAMVGKWHLGMLFNGKHNHSAGVPIGAKVTSGPVDRGGFDLFYGFHHARQMNMIIKNDVVAEKIQPIEMLPKLTTRAIEYINSRQGKKQPFLLYVPWSAPHSPVVPSKEWQGKSGINKHADLCMQVDYSTGQVIAALRANDMLENTLIIASSDNGTSYATCGFPQLKKAGHNPSANLRGYKADAWEGAHRVPFLVSWPKTITPGTTSDQLVCLNDIMATIADINQNILDDNAAVDSMSFLPTLKGGISARKDVIHHTISGHFSIRKGKWKLIMTPGSGGWADPKPTNQLWEKTEKNGQPLVQLYNMDVDKGEQNNLASTNPEMVEELKQMLKHQINAGRTTAGPNQKNDTKILMIKDPRKIPSKGQRKRKKKAQKNKS